MPAIALYNLAGFFFWVTSSEKSLPFIYWEQTRCCPWPPGLKAQLGAPAEMSAPQDSTTQPYLISISITHAPNNDFPKPAVENKIESLNICRWHSEPGTLLPISATDARSKYLLRNS